MPACPASIEWATNDSRTRRRGCGLEMRSMAAYNCVGIGVGHPGARTTAWLLRADERGHLLDVLSSSRPMPRGLYDWPKRLASTPSTLLTHMRTALNVSGVLFLLAG